MVVFDFCCDDGGPDGRHIHTGLTDWMVQQRHVGGFLAFPACDVGLNLQDLYFIPTYFVTFLICMLILISPANPVSGYICVRTSKGQLVSLM
jgi:hypothetical protein